MPGGYLSMFRDMRDLGEKAPGVAEAFKQGLFTIAKTGFLLSPSTKPMSRIMLWLRGKAAL